MGDSIAKLKLEVDSRGVKKGQDELDRLGKSAQNAEKKAKKATDGISKGFNGVATAIAGAFAVNKIIDTITKFEKLNATLITITGSTQAASKAFSLIETFAATTPFQLEEVVGAFVKLKALGLTPSEAALRSYGNTASALGKSLNQMIEAVADAATGEFERLKEFGIKASSQGDRVVFTFQGVATEVGKNAAEIEGYLKSIGDVQFAGAMDQQANTLNVALSNMGDSISKLIVKIGDAGLTSVIKSAADAIRSVASSSLLSSKNVEFLAGAAAFAAGVFATQYVVQLGIAVTATMAATSATKGLMIAMRGLAGAAGIGAVIYAYDFLIEKTGSLTGIFNSLKAVGVTAWAEIQKAALSFVEWLANVPVIGNALGLADLKDEFTALRREIDSNVNDALARYGEQNRVAEKSSDDLADAVEESINKFNKETEATEKSSAALAAYNKLKAKAQSIIERTRTPQEKYAANIKDINNLLEKGLLTQTQYNRALEMYQDELSGTEKAIEKTAGAAVDGFNEIERVAERTFDGFANLVRDALGGSLRDWSDYAGAVKNMLVNMVSDNFAGNLKGSVMGGGSGGLGGGGFDIMGMVSGGLSALSKPMFSSSSLIGSGINKVGSIFGFGAPKAGMIGPTAGLASKFTMGSSLAGMAGGIGANLLGLGGGVGGDIGGTLGGLAGSLIGGPLGAALGSFAGTALGGLFGNKKPSSKLQSGTVDLSTGQVTDRAGLTGKKFSEENQKMVDALAAISGQLANAMGVSGVDLGIAASDRYGMEFAIGGGADEFLAPSDKRQAFDSANEFASALTQELSKYATDMPEEVAKAVQNADFGTTQQSLEKALSEITGAAAQVAMAEAQKKAQEALEKQEADALNVRLLQAQGNTAELRRMELDALQPANRALQERIWRIHDEAEAEAEAAAKAAEIGRERESLERQLLKLEGNTEELRRRELMDIDSSNHALQKRIWALQDEAEAMKEVDESRFSTLLDYERAVARARLGVGTNDNATSFAESPELSRPVLSTTPVTQTGDSATSNEVAQLRSEMMSYLTVISKNSGKQVNVLERWDGDGLPAERTV